MIASTEARRLAAYEEGAGDLLALVKQDDIIVAHIGKARLALPATLEQSLRPLIGHWIAILRTDLPQREYLFRIRIEEPEQ